MTPIERLLRQALRDANRTSATPHIERRTIVREITEDGENIIEDETEKITGDRSDPVEVRETADGTRLTIDISEYDIDPDDDGTVTATYNNGILNIDFSHGSEEE